MFCPRREQRCVVQQLFQQFSSFAKMLLIWTKPALLVHTQQGIHLTLITCREVKEKGCFDTKLWMSTDVGTKSNSWMGCSIGLTQDETQLHLHTDLTTSGTFYTMNVSPNFRNRTHQIPCGSVLCLISISRQKYEEERQNWSKDAGPDGVNPRDLKSRAGFWGHLQSKPESREEHTASPLFLKKNTCLLSASSNNLIVLLLIRKWILLLIV